MPVAVASPAVPEDDSTVEERLADADSVEHEPIPA